MQHGKSGVIEGVLRNSSNVTPTAKHAEQLRFTNLGSHSGLQSPVSPSKVGPATPARRRGPPAELVNQELWFNTQRRGIQLHPATENSGWTFQATLPGNARQLLWESAKQNHLHVSGFESTSTARASTPRQHSTRTQHRRLPFASMLIYGLLRCRHAGADRLSPQRFRVGETR